MNKAGLVCVCGGGGEGQPWLLQQSLWSRRAQTPLKASCLPCLSLRVPIVVPYLETTHCNMLRGC